MLKHFPDVRVGDPIRHEALTVFPLFSDDAPGADYVLSEDAIRAGTLTVEEVNEGGSVPTLLVTNSGDLRALFLEGEELRGAKQNRVLNTSVLVAAGAKTPIPVSCVEAGRWQFRQKHFDSTDTHSSSKLRYLLKRSTSGSLREGHGHLSDQSAVWSEVSRQMTSLGASSPTSSMSDTYESRRGSMEEFRKRLGYVEGATGLAVALGAKVVAADVFDKSSTCRKVWDRLLSGLVMDALETTLAETPPTVVDVEVFLKNLQAAPWEPAPAVGEGEEFRSDSVPSAHASSLVLGEAVVHGSVMVGV